MPCIHEHAHAFSAHDASSDHPEFSESHHCDCHSCDDSSCAEDLEVPQELTVVSTTVPAPASVFELIIFPEIKPVVQPVPPSAVGILASIQTVQLLI
ncbi:MAG: hypothetical protein OES84_05380 [Kiritimatiellaceae bacterium]|nr:hypothetical protein [Kiritimatiellaceae bacterium]